MGPDQPSTGRTDKTWHTPTIQKSQIEAYAQLERCPASIADRYIGPLVDSAMEQSCYECC